MLDLPAHEALSGVSGSISLAAWVFVMVPQLVENYNCKSGDGMSLAFLGIWFFGDLANLIGAIWAGLIPTVIALPIYFCLSDIVLIIQSLYYKFIYNRNRNRSENAVDSDTNDPSQPLLGRRPSSDVGLPGSRRRSSASIKRRVSTSGEANLPAIPENGGRAREWIKNVACVLIVCAIGAIGWILAFEIGLWVPVTDQDTTHAIVGAEILGYASAVAYLGARIPQIIQNFRQRSCEGLSLLFFILSLIGNLTYGGSILFHSISRQYLITNIPWLIGSTCTMSEDIIIFIQFYTYGDRDTKADGAAIL